MWHSPKRRRPCFAISVISTIITGSILLTGLTVPRKEVYARIASLKRPEPQNVQVFDHGNTESEGFTKHLGDAEMKNGSAATSSGGGKENLEVKESLPWWDGGECACTSDGDGCVDKIPSTETIHPTKLKGVQGTCGRKAAADGTGQKVITFSLYGDNPGYWIGLSETLSKIKSWFPGWMVWVYTNPRGRSGILCPLIRDHSNIRICDITNLPSPLNNVGRVHHMMWRMLPLGDPTVDILAVRDSDYVFIKRDKAAVEAWLESGKMFHVMRDHPGHRINVLGGMWGARWDKAIYEASGPRDRLKLVTPKELVEIRNSMMSVAYKLTKRGLDQTILWKLLWPKMVRSLIAHDSFYCKDYPLGWKPWPTQRENGTFVGNAWYRKQVPKQRVNETCPVRCRPLEHRDWVYC